MEQKISSQSDIDYIAKRHIPLLICPDCKKSIPDIEIFLYKTIMFVSLKCVCSQKKKIKSLFQFLREIKSNCKKQQFIGTKNIKKGDKNSINDLKFYYQDKPSVVKCKDNTFEPELKLKCVKHNKTFKVYCKDCDINICEDCKSDHRSHKLVLIQQIDLAEPQLDLFDNVMKKNTECAKRYIDKIDKVIVLYTLMKKDIQQFLKINRYINQDLELLYLSLCKTIFEFKSYPSYELMKMHKTLFINTKEYQETKDDTGLKGYSTILSHFMENYVIMQRPFDESKLTLSEHTDTVFCLANLSDGRFASGSSDKTIRLWNSTTNMCEAILIGHLKSILCLVELKNHRLASGSDDSEILLWSTTTNKLEAILNGHTLWVRYLVKLPDDRLASSSGDKTIKLWNTTTCECKATLTGHDLEVQCLAELNEGRLASGSSDKTIKLWNATTNECKATLTGHTEIVYSLTKLKDSILASGSADMTIKLWNVTTTECQATLTGHSNAVLCLFELNDGRLASSSSDKTIKIWNTTTKECKETLTGHTFSVYSVIQLNSGELASGSYDMEIKLWNV